ncbi:hypothetical protein MCEMRE196_01438 [Candidatus Nanopelagicaceae bacterium]
MKKLAIFTVALSLTVGSIYASPAAEKNPYGISTVDPAGPNEIIFTVSKGGKKTEFATARIQKMKSKTISIYEPFLKKRQTFTVIPLKSFFSLVGISGQDKVATIALNDYIYSNTAAQFTSAGAYIAIKRNGLDIPYDQGGPLRLIFADDSKWAKNLDAWNWSLAAIRVK